jgi:hypothetical protein
MRQIREARAELDRPRPDDYEAGRFARFRVLHVKGLLDMLIDDESLFCMGHEAKKRGPRPKAAPAAPDPSEPPGVEPAKRRKRTTLGLVPDE